MRLAIITFLVLFSVPALSSAQAAPVDNSRVLHTFDFEERRLGNAEDLPMYWEKVTGINFPHYVNGRITTDRHRSGQHSFRVDLDGGSCIYRYEPGRIHVQHGARYRLEGFCHTTALAYARARFTVYLTDVDQHLLPGTVHHSEAYVTRSGDEDWHSMVVELTAEAPEAAFLVLQMELLQPNELVPESQGQRAMFLEDIHGTAWFDDITISQVPEIKLSTDNPGNIFRKSEPAAMIAQVDDRSADDLLVQLLVSDVHDRRVFARTGESAISSSKSLGPGLRRLTLPLPSLASGWYRASLVTMSHGVLVSQQSLDWIRLGDDDPAVAPDPRFGVVATEVPFESWPDLPRILPVLSTGRVKLAVWSKTGDIQQIDPAALDQMLESLGQQGIAPTGCLVNLPPKLSGPLSSGNWLQLLGARDELWQDSLSFMISRQANHIEHWQLGIDGTDDFARNPDMRKVYTKVFSKFATLLDKPDLAMPYPVWYEAPAVPPSSMCLSIPPSILPNEIPLYLQEFKGSKEASNLTVSLTPIDFDSYGREAQISDLVQRVVCSLAGGATRVDLPLPLRIHQQGDHQTIEPLELAMVERTLLSNLNGATFRGKLPVADDVEAYLFDKAGQGILVLWSKNDGGGLQSLAINLGERPTEINLWGDASPLLRVTDTDGAAVSPAGRGDSGEMQLQVGRLPIIVTGVDSPMGQFRANVSIDQPLIESSFEPHARHIRFTNPCNTVIGGTVHLHAPLGWGLNPPTFNFTLNPGETFDREFAIEIPYNSVAGRNVLLAAFDLQADRHTRFSVPIPLKLGLSDVGTQTMAYRDGKDVVVQQMISNYGDKPISYSAFANYPGRPRIERLVSSIGAGHTVIKKYRFTNVPTGKSAKIKVGLKESEGTRILNDEVELK